ncbi:MAG TPA: peptidase M14 [Rhizobiales bacterium]|nr:peptidase M14 [Hyphomicrobiales bacterium]
MEQSEILITGETPGISWSVPVMTFKGANPSAPTAYLQGALHADELPGPVVLHFLCELLRQAEQNNQIAGNITIVPQANPIGLSQMPNRQLQGRFDITTGTNFNRNFPLITIQEREQLLANTKDQNPADQLKSNLLYMALGADIVVDLHCDYESLLYTYVCEEFWPDAKDFAAAMNLHSVFIADGQSTAFDEAVSHAFRKDENTAPVRRLATTLELRGQMDVDEKLAQADATGLFNFLGNRNVITTDTPPPGDWPGKAVPLDYIEVIRTPVAGTVLLAKNIGDDVKTGELLAKIIHWPGGQNGMIKVLAPQDGTIVTRTNARFAAHGDQLYKIIGNKPSATLKEPGTLEY